MSKGKLVRTRRKRRQDKAALKHGKRPKHTLKAGRTGTVHYKKLQGRQP